jgi:hypothetical protein
VTGLGLSYDDVLAIKERVDDALGGADIYLRTRGPEDNKSIVLDEWDDTPLTADELARLTAAAATQGLVPRAGDWEETVSCGMKAHKRTHSLVPA